MLGTSSRYTLVRRNQDRTTYVESLGRRVCAEKDDLFSTVVSIEAGTITLAQRVLDTSSYASETGMTLLWVKGINLDFNTEKNQG